MSEKDALRLEMRRRLALMPAVRDAVSLEENLRNVLCGSQAKNLFGYMAIGWEPDVKGIMQWWLDAGRKLFLPRFDAENRQYEMVEVPVLGGEYISSGKFGILEPAGDLPADSRGCAMSKESVWLVPGMAFSPNGVRLGRGGGYYDRLLEEAPGLKIGIAWDCQIVEEIPNMPFDVPMDYIVTSTRIVPCAAKWR